jgi:DNA-binding response OmpR family regulator
MSKKILIIEDESYLSEMYKIKLESEGYQVAIADNGQDGIAQIENEKPDLVLLDLMMPRMNGFQVLEILKEKKLLDDLKIYILSNLSQKEEVDKGVSLGAEGFLVKASLTPTQVADFIHELFAKKKVKNKTKIQKKSEESKIKQEKENGFNLLLIEDEYDIAEMYEFRLKKAGFKVKVAHNGAWGLKLAKAKKYDLIIMDVVMPAMDGCQMLKKIKKESLNHSVPVIVLSNSAQDKDIEEAKKCGAVSYLLKSQITPVKLIKETKKVLNN